MKEAKELVSVTKDALQWAKGVSVVIAPPNIFLRELAASVRKGRITFAAQNAHYEEGGAFTGEISLPQVKDAKTAYVIVGHAERRALGETNEDTRKKVAAALTIGLTPILCIGEAARTASGEHFVFVKDQLRVGLSDVPQGKLSKILIAYEPVWAIGASSAMNPHDMHEMSIFIKKTLVEKFGESGHNMRVLYGGAVDATNAVDMLRNGDVAGFLVGRASADITKCKELIRAVGEKI